MGESILQNIQATQPFPTFQYRKASRLLCLFILLSTYLSIYFFIYCYFCHCHYYHLSLLLLPTPLLFLLPLYYSLINKYLIVNLSQ